MALDVPKYRYLCGNEFNKEYELVEYNPEKEQWGLDVCTANWQEMLDFTRKLAINYGLTEDDWYRFLWTAFDGDDGTLYLRNGTVFVNRFSFNFTKKPWGIDNNKKINDLTMIEVAWENQDDCGKNNEYNY